jgi:transposase
VTRRWRLVPIGKKPCWVEMDVPRVACLFCGTRRQIHIDFAAPKKHYTHAFRRYVLELCKHMTIQAVARHLGISWDTVKEIHKEYLRQRFSKPRLKELVRLGIDEVYVGKKHYLTIVLDLDSGAVVFVGKGKGQDAIEPFWKKLQGSGAKIEAVAMDMSGAFQAAVRKHLPQATIVFDHFHVIKLMNKRLTELRRELARQAEEAGAAVLKGTRWLLLMGQERLNEEAWEKLQAALDLNQPLATAYYLKEDLRQIWDAETLSQARLALKLWIAKAESSGIKQLIKMANTLRDHREGILAYFKHPISTGPLEGTNNKIGAIQRHAYGYRDQEYFHLKIMASHRSREELIIGAEDY